MLNRYQATHYEIVDQINHLTTSVSLLETQLKELIKSFKQLQHELSDLEWNEEDNDSEFNKEYNNE